MRSYFLFLSFCAGEAEQTLSGMVTQHLLVSVISESR